MFSSAGEKVCLTHKTGENCDECVERYFGVNCTVYCALDPTRYTCTSEGAKDCLDNYTGEECDECAEHYYGVNCLVNCEPDSARYTCSIEGVKECLGNYSGDECDECKMHYYGTNCTVHCVPDSERIQSMGKIDFKYKSKSTSIKVQGKIHQILVCLHCTDTTKNFPSTKLLL